MDTLRAPIKELRATTQLRVLFTWEYDRQMILLLEAVKKKGGRVNEAAIQRAERNRDEWLVTRASDPLDFE